MRYSCRPRTPSHVDNPFPEDCRVYKRCSPKSSSHVRVAPGYVEKSFMGNQAHHAVPERNQVMVHDLQVKALKVWRFSGDMDGEYLSLTVLSGLGSKEKSLEQYT